MCRQLPIKEGNNETKIYFKDFRFRGKQEKEYNSDSYSSSDSESD